MNKKIIITGGILGFLSVVIGAFAAHGLKALISAESIQTFETGVRYQMYHALLLLFIGGTSYLPEKKKAVIFYLVLIGVILFSGSIYGLATNNLTGFDFKTIGFVTPIGGLLMIVGWLIMILSFFRLKSGKN
ncbi:DUF423 domain-containing protein [Formosa algae]|uniref:Uncharacterized membrane protein YgdD (TMEM256/DUF423 family) n=1 Tax=Formosa algae TaxID=225843 RepID=A0A9X0YIW9_9FLAO|nr:DUF423 domain-containing protein [Formosa algae]MBP1839306.1 uncharacterized membrane protein YgdD (TMEM256/DUF423 family) [Formosa algae]MDQ0334083.1 uncharacterized membrane protein YgdD (TMEM256/DUF423 family) [Formosa algae]OEI79409.1 hypothetical protein AST99_14445 [Formosa algae]PNW29436.1 hypothetical protein BKP44_03650 [Formosa algae]